MMKFFKWTLIVVGCLLGIGVVYEQVSRIEAENAFPPHGEFVELNTHKMHFYRVGGMGPTVIFESAFDPVGHLQWFNIQHKLPKTVSSISYDRAGLLWSEQNPNPKSAASMTQDLHQLLQESGATRPYIFVGHSFGGTLMLQYAKDYPDDVDGLILVDARNPNDHKFMSKELYDMTNQPMPSALLTFANEVGLLRQMFKNSFPSSSEYSYQNDLIPALLHKSAHGILIEQDSLVSVYQEVAKVDSLGDIPMLVLTASDPKRFDALFEDPTLKTQMLSAWEQAQRDLLNLSSNSRQVVLEDSGHYINEDRPDALIQAIEDMVNQVSR